jgi:hypothetical protein
MSVSNSKCKIVKELTSNANLTHWFARGYMKSPIKVIGSFDASGTHLEQRWCLLGGWKLNQMSRVRPTRMPRRAVSAALKSIIFIGDSPPHL